MWIKIFLICLIFQNLIDKSYERKRLKIEIKPPKNVEYQYMVSLQIENQGQKIKFCNGVILNPVWIITAAYCFDNIPPNTDVWVNAGVDDCHDYGDDSQYIRVMEHYTHPNYSRVTFDNNIAMLQLERPVLRQAPNIRFVELPSKDYEIATEGTISGWAKSCSISHNKENAHSNLVITTATLVSDHEECENLIPGGKFNPDSELCLHANFSSVCSVLDSGAPFVQYTEINGQNVPKVIGISSLSRCDGKPNIYTNIQYHLDFIKAVTKGAYEENERILQGRKVTQISDFPYMVPIVNLTDDDDYDSALCGGVLINAQWVLTAAHCFDHINTPKYLRVRPGVIYIFDLDKMKPFLKVKNYFIHPNYNPNDATVANDIALIKLERRIKFSAAIQPIKMATPSLIPDKTSIILGWGAIDVLGDFPSPYLLHAVTDIVDSKKCQPITKKKLRESQICVKGVAGTCFGDSGGPLVQIHNNIPYTLGIVSYGFQDCNPTLPAVFTRVASFKKFVDETIENN